MAEAHETPASVETMAFQVLLQKMAVHEQQLSNVEQAMQQMPLLLKRIIDHLEAQTKQPDVPIATYEQLYAKYLEAPEEDADAEAPAAPVIEVTAAPPHKGHRRQRVWRWFVKEQA